MQTTSGGKGESASTHHPSHSSYSSPLGVDGSDELRKRVLNDFQEFDTQQGNWMHSFDAHLPEMPTAEELAKNNKSFGIEQVVKYAEQTGTISGRLQWV